MKTLTSFWVLIVWLHVSAMAQTGPFQTQNVFIVAIDGLRYTEGFESGNRYIPCLWDSLRPQATICTRFMNTGITVTNSGHSTIVTGVRQLLVNNLYIPTAVRPKDPTLGEYYRKALGVPAEKACYISGKNTIWRVPVSEFPGYGPDVAPKVVLASSNDYETWDSTRAIMDSYHPSLCYVLFAQVDAEGHTGDTARYLSAISRADSLTFLLWKKIQSDPVYANKTTMIVTSDHGRHDDQHGGWQDHGDFCRGCRHVIFLAIGPDTKHNSVVTTLRDQIDIAPTVGRFLGFPTPLAQGNVIGELFVNGIAGNGFGSGQSIPTQGETNISGTTGVSRSSSIARNRKGLHVVFSDNSLGRVEVLYTRSTDMGGSWSPPQTVLTDPQGDHLEPAITAVGDSGLYLVSSGYSTLIEDSTFYWLLRGKRSTDGGLSWQAETLLDSLHTVSTKPAISASGQWINTVAMTFFVLRNHQSRNGGVTFSSPQHILIGGYMPTLSCVTVDTTCYAVWQNLLNDMPFWNIWFDYESWGTHYTHLTTNDGSSYSYDPSLCADPSKRLHVVYTQLADQSTAANWQVSYTRSTDLGGTWSPAILLPGGGNSSRPIIRASNNGKLFAVWSSQANNQYSIRCSYSPDAGTTWSSPIPVTAAASMAVEPDFAVSGDTLYVVWRDVRNGNSEIYFKRFQLSTAAVGPEEHPPAKFYLAQNYPNPFNPTTDIQFSIVQRQLTIFKVYDILGREVATLMNEVKGPGTYSLQFDGSGLAAGVYFYRLNAGSFVQTRKMLLIK